MLNRIKIFFFLPLLVLSSCQLSDPPVTERKLVWSDEFGGDSLDLTKWDVMLGDGSAYGLWRWGNEEDQYYQEENITVSGGYLRIKAIADSVAGYGYTSGRIRSLGSADIKYGSVEASIRMANAGGLWHAFWMLPSNPSEPWPVSGEMDIIEYVGNQPNRVFQTIHFADRFGDRAQLGLETPILYDGKFHKYALEWDANRLIWYIDEVETFTVLRSNEAISDAWPFDAKFHVLLNTAVGGNLGGDVDVAALNSAKYMEVDYVRIYQEQ